MQKALKKMDDDKEDEYMVFGKFISNEIKAIPEHRDREYLKRKLQKVVLDFKDEVLILFYSIN